MGLTKSVLKRPVTVVMVILCLIVFGLQSVLGSKLELMPSMDMPVLIVYSVDPGASPEDVNDLVSTKIEDEIGSLSGVDTIQSRSMENVSLVIIQYDYGKDIDEAYDDLKKKMDAIEGDLPDDCNAPVIMELNIDEMDTVSLVINNKAESNLYNYVNNKIVPEFEKITTVTDVSISGGQKEYIQVELIPEKLEQYHLTLASVASSIGSADFTYPSGDTIVGGQKLSVSAGTEYDTEELLKTIPLNLGNGNVIYLSDIANVQTAQEDADSIARYNGEDTISIGIKKQQSASAVDVSKSVKQTIKTLMDADENLEIVTVNDTSDNITSSLKSVMQTMVMAVVVSMLIIFLFFGEIKASLIVGTSIPISILAALILIQVMGFSLNVVTLSSLVLGVGMMVDNSINVLDGCFRAKEHRNFFDAAIEGSRIMITSIVGGTATTCVVFIPLAMLSGLSGQMFKQLGFTIVFSLIASLFSAVTIVPLCYYQWHPVEKENAPVAGFIRKCQEIYRNIMPGIIPKTKTVISASILLLVFSFFLASRLDVKLMVSTDEGIVDVTVKTKPGLSVAAVNDTVSQIENMVANDEEVDHYLLTYGSSGLSTMGGSSVTLSAYLKDDRKMSTDEVIDKWTRETENYKDISVTMEQGSTTSSSMSSTNQIEVDLQSTDYDALKKASDELVEELRKREDVMQVHSSIENAAPVIKVNVDPVLAQAEGLTPASIGSLIYSNLSGIKATTVRVNGEDTDVRVEFDADKYDSIDKLQGMMITTATGTTLPLEDLATIHYEDSPQQIQRKNKQYQVSITMEPQSEYKKTAEKDVKEFVRNWNMPNEVEMAPNAMDESMGSEIGALGGALITGVFLVFVVMAIQFESPKFSLMIMTTIPFSLIGSFGLLFLADSPISMVSMLGFLMLVGTVVNNGILYVDTVNQFLAEMPLDKALVEAGAIRMRPILMTTGTTVISMLPNAVAYGKSGAMMQGLALVDVGGLIAATILTLILLPTYYRLVHNMGRKAVGEDVPMVSD